MPITTPDEKFAYELGSIYDAEHRILAGQQEMLRQANDGTLQSMLQTHIDETQQQIANLEQVFSLMGQQPQRVSCEAAAGLVTDGEKALQQAAGNAQLQDCLIAAAQAKVEHLEMSAYRGLVLGAQMMGQQEVQQLLQENLGQEERTAQLVEQQMPTLLQQAMQAQGVGG